MEDELQEPAVTKTTMYYEEGRSDDIKHVISHLGYEPCVIFLDLSRQVLNDKYDDVDYNQTEAFKRTDASPVPNRVAPIFV